MRFFTVPTAQQARKSVVWAMAIIGGFYVLTLFLGFGAAKFVGPAAIASVDAGGNMAAPLLAQYLAAAPTRSSATSCWRSCRRWPSPRS